MNLSSYKFFRCILTLASAFLFCGRLIFFTHVPEVSALPKKISAVSYKKGYSPGKNEKNRKNDIDKDELIDNESISDSKKSIDVYVRKEEILKMGDTLCDYYAHQKQKHRVFQNAGLYPSFMILKGVNDITLSPLPEGWKAGITFSLINISATTLYPIERETASYSFSHSDHIFFLLLIQALMEDSSLEKIEVKIKGLKKGGKGDTSEWILIDEFSVSRSVLSGKKLDQINPGEFWNLMPHKHF